MKKGVMELLKKHNEEIGFILLEAEGVDLIRSRLNKSLLERKNGDLLKAASKIFSQVYDTKPKCNNLNSIVLQGTVLLI